MFENNSHNRREEID
jgi:hypothetical protein